MNTLYESKVKVNGKVCQYHGQKNFMKIGSRYINIATIKSINVKSDAANKVFQTLVNFVDGEQQIFNHEDENGAIVLKQQIKSAVKELKSKKFETDLTK